MDLKSLTYTSFARLDLRDDDIVAIHRAARETNALNGVSGLLIFNGTHFLQIIEGPTASINELLARLREDPRHHQLEVRDERIVTERQFPGWSMKLIGVSSRYLEAQEAIVAGLPAGLPTHIISRILKMTQLISGVVNLPD